MICLSLLTLEKFIVGFENKLIPDLFFQNGVELSYKMKNPKWNIIVKWLFF